MRNPDDLVRQQVVRALDWEDAHVGFSGAVADLEPPARGVRPPGFDHSVWELVEHIRRAQDDILAFCLDPGYAHTLTFPDDYWPPAAVPPSEAAWAESVAGYRRGLAALQRLAGEVDDLTARVPTGTEDQTYLRALLLAADHAAYHVGQIVAVRRALGAWR